MSETCASCLQSIDSPREISIALGVDRFHFPFCPSDPGGDPGFARELVALIPEIRTERNH